MKVTIRMTIPTSGKDFGEVIERVVARIGNFGLPSVPDLEMDVEPMLTASATGAGPGDEETVLTWLATVRVDSFYEATNPPPPMEAQ